MPHMTQAKRQNKSEEIGISLSLSPYQHHYPNTCQVKSISRKWVQLHLLQLDGALAKAKFSISEQTQEAEVSQKVQFPGLLSKVN